MERVAETGKQHEPSPAMAGHGHATSPFASSLPPALELQQFAGNQAMQQLLRSGFIQAKLAISNPDDPEEREADNVAHTIMRKAAGAPCSCSPGEEMCEECQQEQSAPAIQRRASSPSAPPHVPRIVSDVLRSPGHPLDSATRAFFEPRFGRDFSHVRVHTDSPAANSARSINAHAYTAGSDIVFASGQYSPGTAPGRTLLAHELTHVVQQPRASSLANVNSVDSSGEANAEQVVKNIAAGQSAGYISSHNLSVQRQEPIPIENLGKFGDPKFGDLAKFGEFEKSSPPDVARPVSTPSQTPAETPTPTQTPTSPQVTPKPGFGPFPVPPVIPSPQPSPGEDQERKRDSRCGSKELPLTMVTFFPGPLGQARRVKASPLTKCPGNTVGSPPDPSVYRDQFDCINNKGQKGSWVRAHLLHGETDRSGPFNLHGPGDIRNLIIADKSINTRMSQQVESPVITGAYAFNKVYWYDSSVLSYVSGKEFFSAAIQLRVGSYNTDSGIEGPAIPELCQTFALKDPANVPDCPPSAVPGMAPPSAADAAHGVTPPVNPATAGKTPFNDLQFKSTIKICQKELTSPHVFEVNTGGLEVRVFAQWFNLAGDQALGAPDCPIDHFFVRLEKSGLIFGFNEVSTHKIPVGQNVEPLKWRGLDKDKYRLKFFVEGDHPSCCLQGDVAVSTFDSRPLA